MVPIERETNIEVVRNYAIWFRAEYEGLLDAHKKIVAEIEASKQDFLSEDLKVRLHRLEKMLFGFGRETLKDSSHRPNGHRDEQLKLHGFYVAEEPQPDAETAEGGTKTSDPVVKMYEMPDNEFVEESRLREIKEPKKAWKEIKGLYQDSTEITVTERIYQKVIHRQKKYRLKDEYNTTGQEVIITAPGPAKLKSGCQYSIDFALAVVTDKYEYHLPLERQRRKMEQGGLSIEVKTLYNLCESVAEHCRPLENQIRKEIGEDFCAVHMDETPWRILSDKQSGYMWVLSNRRGCYYQFEPTRSGKVPERMLKGYKGAVVTDAYAGYNRVRGDPDIRTGLCWSHARREFYDRLDDYPADCDRVIRIMDRLFDLEGQAKDFDELRQIRSTQSKQVIEELRVALWEIRSRYLNSQEISKAINYVLGHWDGLTLFLRDLSVPLTNNDAERALRHTVVGRKNFAGSKTINGADTAATLYTIIESAKRCSLKPSEYLKYVITERWHKREPKTPLQYTLEKNGPSKKIKWPEKDQWKV